jgi:hypothetical protein
VFTRLDTLDRRERFMLWKGWDTNCHASPVTEKDLPTLLFLPRHSIYGKRRCADSRIGNLHNLALVQTGRNVS